MKQQLPTTSHDRHDAMLIVRLHDGDLSERERTQADELVAECSECQQLLADLGAISVATRSLPTPPRPRDFFLTEADAARLGRPDGVAVQAPGRRAWSNLRRSLGGALAALGLVGVLLTGASAFLTPSHSARFSSMDTSGPNSVPAAGVPMPATGVAVPTAAPAQLGPQVEVGQTPGSESAHAPGSTSRNTTTAIATPPPAPAASALDLASAAPATPASQQQGSDKSAATPPGPSTAPAADGGQIVAAPSEGYSFNNGNGTAGGSAAATSSATGLDMGQFAFAGFGLALVLGLGLLAGPKLLRLAGRRAR